MKQRNIGIQNRKDSIEKSGNLSRNKSRKMKEWKMKFQMNSLLRRTWD